MDKHSFPNMLTLQQTIGLLQRFMPDRDAAVWLENDRAYQPVVPFVRQGDEIRYYEEDVAQFVRKLVPNPALRRSMGRRADAERRYFPTDRREHLDRRYSRRAARNDLDRRFAVRPDRRSDLDRRIRGWVDRRCIEDRRGPSPIPHTYTS
jgi:hypothetical protein